MRILFIAEGVTLAHVARPLVLASSANTSGHDVVFACDPRYDKLLDNYSFERKVIRSIPSEQFAKSLSRGSPLYTEDELSEYVETELQLIKSVKPDLIVGDFRLSLSVSARLSATKYATITNAYWSPYIKQRYIVPSLPISRLLPIPIAQFLFDFGRPLAFLFHTIPLNRVRRRYGLPALGWDLRRIYTDADYVMYADLPDQFPSIALPDTHHFIGPILWSPPMALPSWWESIPGDQPIIYVTPGSSGDLGLLPTVLRALEGMQVSVIASSAGGTDSLACRKNLFVSDYLPGMAAALRSQLVICNGGSPTCHQAMAAGVPIIGIANNLDQYLNLETLRPLGVASCLRADRLNENVVRNAVIAVLSQFGARSNLLRLKERIGVMRVEDRFNEFLKSIEKKQ